MKFENNKLLYDNDTSVIDFSKIIDENCILESVQYNEENNEITIYIRKITSLKYITLNYKIEK